MKKLISLFFLLLFMYALSAKDRCLIWWGIIRHDVNIDKYRKIGSKPEFAAVGRYATAIESKDYAAGVLIAPRWILTASHFLDEKSVWMFRDKFYQTKRIIFHPKLTSDAVERQWDGWDLALVELEKEVKDVKPALRYRGQSEVGTVITKIGYGFVGDGINGLQSPRIQERLGGHNIIDAAGGVFEARLFSSDVLVCDFDNPASPEGNTFGSPEPLEMEIGGSKGDSGGGCFAKIDGKWQLVGVVSGGLKRDVKYGAVLALARVSSANHWIDAIVKDSAKK